MVQGKLPVPGRPTTWMIVGQGPAVLAVGAGRVGLMMMMILCLTTRQPTGSFASIRLCFTIYNVKYI